MRLARLEAVPLIVPAGVLGQVWRDGTRQARVAALIGSAACQVDILDGPAAKAAGVLCGRSGTTDVIDASVVLAARARSAVVVTSDPQDLLRIDPGLTVEQI